MVGEVFAYILAFGLLTFLVGYIASFFFSILSENIRNKIDHFIFNYHEYFAKNIKNKYEQYFLGRLAYYDKLSSEQRIKFLLRVRRFMRSKSFEGRQGFEVTEEIKARIAASAVQITFGHQKYILDFFTTIIIYPQSYYSTLTGNHHKGEVNSKGVIVISWSDFLKGYEISDDKLNLGLHEMAHALELGKRLGGDYDFYFDSYYEKWSRITEKEFSDLKEGEESFFRQYAGTNRQEFFAVCIEHFFEAPEEFRNIRPQIYYHLCILLNQDPLSHNLKVESIRSQSMIEAFNEALSSQEIFASRYSYLSLAIMPAIFMALFGLFAINNKVTLGPVLYAGAMVTFVHSIPFLFTLNRIILYDKFIGIKNIFGKLKAAYRLDEIVSISFFSERYGDSIRILTIKDGKILKHTYSYQAKSKGIAELTRLLADKNVIVK